MHSVKSVKKALTKRLPRYNLRSRKKSTPVIVRDQETQADLSDEDREALFAELPFHSVSSPESDAEVEVHLNPSSSYTYPVPSSSQVPPTARHSTAFSTPNQAEITDFDPRRILCVPKWSWRRSTRYTHSHALPSTLVSFQFIFHWTFRRTKQWFGSRGQDKTILEP